MQKGKQQPQQRPLCVQVKNFPLKFDWIENESLGQETHSMWLLKDCCCCYWRWGRPPHTEQSSKKKTKKSEQKKKKNNKTHITNWSAVHRNEYYYIRLAKDTKAMAFWSFRSSFHSPSFWSLVKRLKTLTRKLAAHYLRPSSSSLLHCVHHTHTSVNNISKTIYCRFGNEQLIISVHGTCVNGVNDAFSMLTILPAPPSPAGAWDHNANGIQHINQWLFHSTSVFGLDSSAWCCVCGQRHDNRIQIVG